MKNSQSPVCHLILVAVVDRVVVLVPLFAEPLLLVQEDRVESEFPQGLNRGWIEWQC